MAVAPPEVKLNDASQEEDPEFPPMGRVPTRQSIAPSRKVNGPGVGPQESMICVVMVGLPARGKSLIAQKGESDAF